MENCCVGTVTKTDCHPETYSKKKLFYVYEELTSYEKALLSYRISHLSSKESANFICHHHKCRYLDYFSRSYTKCCDPFHRHRKQLTDQHQLRIIDLAIAGDSIRYLGKLLIPGDKLCRNCLSDVKNKIKKSVDEQNLQVRTFFMVTLRANKR